VILSFLKRERTVNVILQSFLTVYLVQYDRFIPFTVPDRPPFLIVTMTVPDRFLNAQKRKEKVRNRNGNDQERGEQYETIILYKINGQKRLQNHVQVHVSKTKESLNDFFGKFNSNLLIISKVSIRILT
jgi:hypothetical protein